MNVTSSSVGTWCSRQQVGVGGTSGKRSCPSSQHCERLSTAVWPAHWCRRCATGRSSGSHLVPCSTWRPFQNHKWQKSLDQPLIAVCQLACRSNSLILECLRKRNWILWNFKHIFPDAVYKKDNTQQLVTDIWQIQWSFPHVLFHFFLKRHL